MSECGIFVDETGGQGGHSKYYAVTIVVHDKADNIEERIRRQHIGLVERGLPDIPFHAGPLMTGHHEYENMDLKARKAYFSVFYNTLQHLPIRYRTLLYKRSELKDDSAFISRIKRDLVNVIFDNLEYFQSFSKVKVYYDNAQNIVTQSVREAAEYALAKGTVEYRKASPDDYVLLQAADLLCTLELTACKYRNHESTKTDEKFFGSAGSFKNNYMKAIKRKRL